MARPRAKASENEYTVPAEYAEEHDVTPAFQRAYNHAMKKGNSTKAALLYADAHFEEWEDAEE